MKKQAIFSSFHIHFQFQESMVYFHKTVIFGRFAIYFKANKLIFFIDYLNFLQIYVIETWPVA